MALELEEGYPMLDDVIRRLTSIRERRGNVPVILECDWSGISHIDFVPEGEHPVLVREGDIVIIDSIDNVPF